MVHVSAGQAQRTCVVHDEQVARALALSAGPVPNRLDDNQVGWRILGLRDAFALLHGKVARNPARPPHGLHCRGGTREEAKRAAVRCGRNVLCLSLFQAAFPGPAVQADDELGDLVAVHRQEVPEIVRTAVPPVIHVAGVQPAETEADVDRRDEPLPGQGLCRGRHDPGVQAPATHIGTLLSGRANRDELGRRHGSDQGRFVGVNDRVEQAGEAAVDVFLAQLGVALGALDALGDQARLAHDAQVVGEGRLAQLEPGLLPDLGAPRLAVCERGSGRSPAGAGRPARPALSAAASPSAAGSTTSSITLLQHRAHLRGVRRSVVQFDPCRTTLSVTDTVLRTRTRVAG